MKSLFVILTVLFLQILHADAAPICEKVLICGVCKNVEKAVPNTIDSVKRLGEQFLDYRVVIYENNSCDKTKELLREWAKGDNHVILMSEDLPKKKLAKQLQMKICNRTEAIALARNKVLGEVMQDKYRNYKYVIWADLDFLDPWDVDQIVETILHPEQEWDAVLSNGAYDLFALRDSEFPIGFELIGNIYWQKINEIRSRFILDPNGSWRKVYSAFGGMGIYKRESIQGCRYSGVVTRDLEMAVLRWLKLAHEIKNVCFLEDYDKLLREARIINLFTARLGNRKALPDEIGVRLNNAFGMGKVVWFSCTPKKTLPWTCEHVPFHASMALRGRDKIFINPRWKSHHP